MESQCAQTYFSRHVLGAIVHSRFYLKYFAYFQMKDLGHCLCITTERLEHISFFVKLSLEWQKSFGLPRFLLCYPNVGIK